jgi:hypothetical protein
MIYLHALQPVVLSLFSMTVTSHRITFCINIMHKCRWNINTFIPRYLCACLPVLPGNYAAVHIAMSIQSHTFLFKFPMPILWAVLQCYREWYLVEHSPMCKETSSCSCCNARKKQLLSLLTCIVQIYSCSLQVQVSDVTSGDLNSRGSYMQEWYFLSSHY